MNPRDLTRGDEAVIFGVPDEVNPPEPTRPPAPTREKESPVRDNDSVVFGSRVSAGVGERVHSAPKVKRL